MLRLLGFVLAGVVVAFVGEVQYSLFIRGDLANLRGSVGFNSLYLTLWYPLVALLLRRLGQQPLTVLVLTLTAGVAGLAIEWFVIGNSPWGNPAASELGMFAYWACMIVVPVALLDRSPHTLRLRRTTLLYGAGYTLLALAVEFIPNADIRYVYHIWSVVVGYSVLLAITAFGLVRGWQPEAGIPAPASGTDH